MYFADEIRTPSEELDSLPKDATFEGRELQVAKKLVESLTVEWAPEDYHNTYRARVEELIERKREGNSVVFEPERPKSNVIDLMAALEASVASTGQARAAAETSAAGAAPPARAAVKAVNAGKGGSRPGKQDPDLDGMSKADLLARAAEHDIQGRSKMTKPQLVAAIADAAAEIADAAPKRRGRRIS
jgi:DNA end-binding protein Ku